MLISGGLIVFGLLAVVGAFFLARTGESANVIQNIAANQETDAAHNHTLAAPKQDKIPATIVREERDITLLNGQLEDLTEQIQSLQQRLIQLSTIVEHEENDDEKTRFAEQEQSVPEANTSIHFSAKKSANSEAEFDSL